MYITVHLFGPFPLWRGMAPKTNQICNQIPMSSAEYTRLTKPVICHTSCRTAIPGMAVRPSSCAAARHDPIASTRAQYNSVGLENAAAAVRDITPNKMHAQKQMRPVVKREEVLYGRADTERSQMHHQLNEVEDEMFVGIQATTVGELQSHLRTRTSLLQTCRKLLLEQQLEIGKLRKRIREQQQQEQHQKHRQQQYQPIYSHHHHHHLQKQQQQQQQQQSEQLAAVLAAAVAPAAAEAVHSPAGGAAEPALAFIPAAAPVAAHITQALHARHNYFTRMNYRNKTEK